MFIAASSNPARASRSAPARLKGRAPWKSVSRLAFAIGADFCGGSPSGMTITVALQILTEGSFREQSVLPLPVRDAVDLIVGARNRPTPECRPNGRALRYLHKCAGNPLRSRFCLFPLYAFYKRSPLSKVPAPSRGLVFRLVGSASAIDILHHCSLLPQCRTQCARVDLLP